jgi:hypothetical protein
MGTDCSLSWTVRKSTEGLKPRSYAS